MLRAEEHLRLAYLAAMDITVWVPRTGDEPAQPDVQPPAPARSAVASGAQRTREALGVVRAPVSGTRADSPTHAVARQTREAAPEQAAVSLLFAVVGNVLFVDRMPSGDDAPAASALLASIGFAVSGKSATVESQSFDWPPPGVAVDAHQTRDAVLARLRKRLQESAIRQIVVMGVEPANLLLGWDESRFAQRDGRVQFIEGIDVPVLVTLASAVLVREPVRKRDAWRDLRAARS